MAAAVLLRSISASTQQLRALEGGEAAIYLQDDEYIVDRKLQRCTAGLFLFCRTDGTATATATDQDGEKLSTVQYLYSMMGLLLYSGGILWG